MFVYNSQSAVVSTNFTTSGTANTEVDHCFLKPGTRNLGVQSLTVGGKGAGLTSLSGIAYRLKKYPTTASSGGTAVTPSPKDVGMQAAKATCGMSASAGVTAGTGTAVFLGGCYSGAAGPGAWAALNPDSLPTLEGSDNKSIDLYTSSGTISLNFEFNLEHVE